jgi:hypothetical protein
MKRGLLQVLFPVFLQARERTNLIPPHQAGVADHVCRKDGRQPALLTPMAFPELAAESVGIGC